MQTMRKTALCAEFTGILDYYYAAFDGGCRHPGQHDAARTLSVKV